MYEAILAAAASLAFLVVMFVPLERAFQAKEQPFLRKGFVTDLLFFFGQYMLFTAAAVGVISWAVTPVDAFSAAAALRRTFGALPMWAQVAIVLGLGDFVAYWGHRLQHRVDFLWRFHAVHHTNEEIDWLAAHREHPLDGLYTQTLINLPAVALGFDVAAVLGVAAFRSLWAIFIHSNVRVPLGPLKYVVGSPNIHRWHHARDRDVGNYANLAPWIDLLFGTYYLPDEEPEALGVSEPMPDDYIGLLIAPLRPTPQHPDVASSSTGIEP